MSSDYPSKLVILGYFVDKQDAGTTEKRAKWSDDLFTRYNQPIVAACSAAGYDPSEEARAIMAVMSLNAPGASPQTKAQRAVQAYLEYRGW